MEPEFAEGEVIIIEPSVVVEDGCYVVALHDGEYLFRQLRIQNGRWFLNPLNQQYDVAEIPGGSAIKGRIISKSNGRGRQCKSYL
jgi:SOS-response transcriptional repressor LexA